MKLAFALFKYFPYGGLQRDCLKIAEECVRRGHSVDIYCIKWAGPSPRGISVHVVNAKAWRNYRRYEIFALLLRQQLDRLKYDGVIGFNRMAGLDFYFAADPCFALKCEQRQFWYRYLPHSQSFLRSELMVYGKDSTTEIMLLSEQEIPQIQRLYGTTTQRFHLLPPGVVKNQFVAVDYYRQRAEFRQELGLVDEQKLLLMVGSGFKVKGVDRAIAALASLPEPLRQRTVLMILGRDNSSKFKRQARRLGISDKVKFLGGRDDAARFFFAADLLVHPAYREAAGMVLLEAVAAQLPVLATDTCGYSFHIQRSGAGCIHQSPFDLQRFSSELTTMLEKDPRVWQQAAHKYVVTTDIFGLATRAVDVIEQGLQ